MSILFKKTKKLMKKLFTILIFCCAGLWLSAQSVSGTLIDGLTGEPLIGASVIVDGTGTGTVTDVNGNFILNNVAEGTTLLMNYLGYQEKMITVTGANMAFGPIGLSSSSLGLKEVEVIANIAIDRRTPVAVSTIKGETIALESGNQEYVEVLRKTPSIYVTKSGGGFGDSRINVRGFDQRNTAVMINGIPVNDMENGWVYWSNWAGLSDVTSNLQVQRGLGASKLAIPAVGGSINIITNAAEMKQGGVISASVGNDAYLKGGFAYNSGLMNNGIATSIQLTRTQGDGYVDGTQFSAWSYFVSLSKMLSDKSSLGLTVVGAPQWHHQRDDAGQYDEITLRTFVDPDDVETLFQDSLEVQGVFNKGIKFNHVWGMLDGEEFTWRRNFYHKPKAMLNHFYTISNKTDIKTSLYASIGRGGGTGPRGRLQNPTTFDSFGGFNSGTHDENGQVRFDDIVSYNEGTAIDGFGDANSEPGTTTSGGDGFIRRASMNYHNWYGGISTLTHDLSDELTFTGGVDLRYYLGEHFRRVENLLGNTTYESGSDDNNPSNLITEESPADFLNFTDDSYKNSNNVLNYHNDGKVRWAGLFGQVEYLSGPLSVFASASGSSQSFQRIDYFGYLDSDPEQTSEWVRHLGGAVKAGANYNFGNSNVFANAGYLSKQPIFDNVFLNFSNDIDEEVENQNITGIEAGYGWKSRVVSAKFNVYSTLWSNQTISRGFDFIDDAGIEIEGTAQYKGIAQRHNGLEFEATIQPADIFSIDLMASIGDWVYTEDYEATIFDDNQNVVEDKSETIYASGLEVGDAAQTTFNVGLNVFPVEGLRIYGDYYFADRLFAQFSIEESQFLAPDGVVAQLPSYSLIDAGVSYKLNLGGAGSNTGLTLFGNVNNLADKIYISEMFTNIPDNPDTDDINEIYDNKGFVGFGRTWNIGAKFSF